MQDEHVHLPPAFGGCFLLLFAISGSKLWLKKHVVYRGIRNGMGEVLQELSMEMNRNMAKKLAHLSTQQLTIDQGRGKKINLTTNKKSEQK